MPQPRDGDGTHRRSALCVGIGTYTHLDRILRYAAADATSIAKRLADPQRGNFTVTVLTKPAETTKAALEEEVKRLLSAPDQHAEDLVLLYFSCHGAINQADHTFCLLPSDVSFQKEEMLDPTTLISIYDFARWLSAAKTRNIVVLLDVCHSGGAGATLQHFLLDLDAGPNYFFIGAARQDQDTVESSKLKHGLFTHCLLRAFMQPPTADGWLTISQILTFVTDEIKWFAKNRATPIQSSSVSVNLNLPLLRNPQYPELAPRPPLWHVPQRNIFFTGQDELLLRLASMLETRQKTASTQPCALSGLGGIGKTQLALEYAYRHRQDYHAVLWGSADTREALISTFVNIAHLLDLPEKDEPDQMSIVEAVKIWLRDRSQWLFILDNVEDLALVQEFLPLAFWGHLLLTTRTQIMGKVVKDYLEVGEMGPETGAWLLLRRAKMLTAEALLEEAPEEEATKAKELAEELGGLPLAIDQVGAYIEETKCSLTHYQRLYQTQRAKLLAHRGGPQDRQGHSVDDHPESVIITWSVSFERLTQRNPAAAELLQFCAFLAPDTIPEELFSRGAGKLGAVLAPVAADAYEVDQAIAALGAYSFVSRNRQTEMLSIHRLVQAVLQDFLSPEEQRLWSERAILAVNAAFPHVEHKAWSQCERLLPQALSVVQGIEENQTMSKEAGRLLYETACYLHARAHYAKAERLYQQSIRIREQVLGPEHPHVAHPLNMLAAMYEEQGRYAEAEPLLRRSLHIAEQQGPEHADVAYPLTGLANLYSDQGKYAEAERLYQRSLQIAEQQLGETHPFVTYSLNSLAILYREQGKYADAETLYQRVLRIREQQLGEMHPDVADPLHNLAAIYYDQGKYAEAERLYQRALYIVEHQLGPEHPQVIYPLHGLAALYEEQGKYAEAERLYQRALHIVEQQEGLEDPHVTASMICNFANHYYNQRKYAEAEPLYQRALRIREQLGQGNPHVADPLNGLANLYRDQGKHEEAEALYQRALHIWEQFDPEHSQVAYTLYNFANLRRDQGKDVEAEQLYQRALHIAAQQLGLEHPGVAEVIYNLAKLYVGQRKYAEAERHYQRALNIQKQTLGPNHPKTTETHTHLIALLRAAGKHEEAAQLEGNPEQ